MLSYHLIRNTHIIISLPVSQPTPGTFPIGRTPYTSSVHLMDQHYASDTTSHDHLAVTRHTPYFFCFIMLLKVVDVGVLDVLFIAWSNVSSNVPCLIPIIACHKHIQCFLHHINVHVQFTSLRCDGRELVRPRALAIILHMGKFWCRKNWQIQILSYLPKFSSPIFTDTLKMYLA